MKTPWLATTLLLGLIACGDDDTASSSAGAGGTTSSSPGSGGAGDGGAGGSMGSAGGGGEGGAEAPLCPAEELCALVLSAEDIFDCEGRAAPFAEPIPEDRIADARCVLEALRDRTRGSVRVGFDNAGYCGNLDIISIGDDRAHVLHRDYLDLGGNERGSGHALLAPDVYQACLDLPDEELHTCFGSGMLYGADGPCPRECFCR